MPTLCHIRKFNYLCLQVTSLLARALDFPTIGLLFYLPVCFLFERSDSIFNLFCSNYPPTTFTHRTVINHKIKTEKVGVENNTSAAHKRQSSTFSVTSSISKIKVLLISFCHSQRNRRPFSVLILNFRPDELFANCRLVTFFYDAYTFQKTVITGVLSHFA